VSPPVARDLLPAGALLGERSVQQADGVAADDAVGRKVVRLLEVDHRRLGGRTEFAVGLARREPERHQTLLELRDLRTAVTTLEPRRARRQGYAQRRAGRRRRRGGRGRRTLLSRRRSGRGRRNRGRRRRRLLGAVPAPAEDDERDDDRAAQEHAQGGERGDPPSPDVGVSPGRRRRRLAAFVPVGSRDQAASLPRGRLFGTGLRARPLSTLGPVDVVQLPVVAGWNVIRHATIVTATQGERD